MRYFFSSLHNYLDIGSGAAVTTREELLALSRRGHEARTLCGALFDGEGSGEEELVRTLNCLGITSRRRVTTAKVDGVRVRFREYCFNDAGVDSTVFVPIDERGFETSWNPASEASFLAILEQEFDEFVPEILATYGGQATVSATAKKARRKGIKSVFMLHNLSYRDPTPFSLFDAVVVPSEFARTYYKRTLGFGAKVVAPLIDPKKVIAANRDPRYLTFVNPTQEKGLFFFVGIARELCKRRPDIPILIVEGRGKVADLGKIPEARRLTNLRRLERVACPSEFLRETRVLIFPSLCEESFGRVVVEAGMNGAPVVCSDRGAIPEVVGDSDLVLPIPSRFRPELQLIPTAEEIEPWLATITSLWDDASLRERTGERLREFVRRFDYDATCVCFVNVLSEIIEF